MDPGACAGCPSRVEERLDPWVAHLLWLENLIGVGCRFGLGELTMSEWSGLIALSSARNRRTIRKMKDRAADERG